jgi:hypothetical protein
MAGDNAAGRLFSPAPVMLLRRSTIDNIFPSALTSCQMRNQKLIQQLLMNMFSRSDLAFVKGVSSR